MATNSKFYQNPVRETREFQRFNEEYFSGADVRIYFGDVWVDEVTQLQFSLQENTAPIFGYASYTWDAIAIGNRQIQGSFRINFKEAYYLHAITNYLDQKLDKKEAFRSPGSVLNTSTGQAIPGMSIEHLLSAAENFSPKVFEDKAFEFEKTLWGASENQNMKKLTDDRSKYPWFASRMRDEIRKDGFSILITYGPYAEQYDPSRDGASPSTAHSLVGVHLTGVQQIIGLDGSPVAEEYTFIAKDLDQNINIGLSGSNE